MTTEPKPLTEAAEYLRDTHRWDSVDAWSNETFGLDRTLGRTSKAEVILVRGELSASVHEAGAGLG